MGKQSVWFNKQTHGRKYDQLIEAIMYQHILSKYYKYDTTRATDSSSN